METTLHPGPFRAEQRGGGHVVVDARGVVVARIEGEWPHRTAHDFARAANDGRVLDELQARLNDAKDRIEGLECDLEDEVRDCERAEKAAELAQAEVGELRLKLRRAESEVASLRETLEGEGVFP